MARILISWMAVNNDFIDGTGKPKPEGPTSLVHKDFFNYDYHLLLSGRSETHGDTRFDFLVNYLRRTYKNEIREQYMNLNDVIDLKEISAKVNQLLLEHRKDEIDVFISPGTPTMQVAWYLAHLQLGLKTRLFQLRPVRFAKSKQSEQVWVDFEKSSTTSSLIIKEELTNKPTDGQLKITNSIKPIYDLAAKVAAADNVTVLILGETGTGKEGLARFIHENSPRSKGTFMAVNCSAMGDQLLESRLFGYQKGAFTGADKETQGYFQDANGGTIFLDEIGDISPYMQQSLLRVLQEKKITKIGATIEESIDVRVIAATNKDLLQLCNEDKFRRDLFYRLSVVDLTLPPLRERGVKDMEEIFNFMLEKKSKEFNTPKLKFTKQIKKQIFSYPFPGNIRELENIIERLYATADDEVTDVYLPKRIYQDTLDHSLKLADVENEHIRKVYEMCNKNGKETCRILEITYNTLKSKLGTIYGHRNDSSTKSTKQ